jgi:hypothetical protein
MGRRQVCCFLLETMSGSRLRLYQLVGVDLAVLGSALT